VLCCYRCYDIMLATCMVNDYFYGHSSAQEYEVRGYEWYG